MALQLAKKLDNGLDAPEAYVRIIECRFGDRRGISISVHYFTNKAAREGNMPSIDGASHRFDFKPDEVIGDMSIKEWSYGKLKLLDEFSSATDV